MPTVWTPALDAALRQGWSAGKSTKTIGDELELTKHAIIGRAHRLHLPSRPSPIKPKPARAEPAPETAALIAEFRAKTAVPVQKPEPARPVIVIPVVVAVPEPEPVVVPTPQPAPRITLPQSSPFAANVGCQWPTTYGVKTHRFECTGARVTGWAYCATHAARCYTTWGRTAA